MNCVQLILLRNICNLRNRPGRFLKLFPVKSYTPKIEGLRTLYGPSYLGLDGFVKLNSKIKEEYGDTNSFLKNLERFELENRTIFVEDLKILVACCGDDKSLIEKTIKFVKRYFDQVKDLHIKPFVFGPMIMRLLYIHDVVDEAVELILDEEYGKVFYQKASYQVIMDKLFKKGRYEEVKMLMGIIISEKPFDVPVTAVTLTTGSNYKIGTEDALENSLKLIQLTSKKRVQIRTIAFVAGLALKLDKPAIALEILGHSDSSTHYLISNIKVLAKARLGHIDEVLSILKSSIVSDLPKTSNIKRKNFSFDVIEEVEKIVNDTFEMEKIAQFKHFKQVLETTNLLSNQTLDEALCDTIHIYIKSDDEMKKPVRRRKYEE